MDNPKVPKFGSFKPKAPAISKTSTKDIDDEREHRHRHRGHSSSKRRRTQDHSEGHSDSARWYHDSRDDRHKRQTSEFSERNHHHTKLPVTTVALDTKRGDDERSDLWLVDRRGDVKNVEYGGMHRYSVPPYHRFGSGRVLGAPRNLRIDRDASSDKSIVFRQDGYVRSERLLASKRNIFSSRTKRIIPDSQPPDMDHDQDYVALRPSKLRKRRSQSPDDLHDGVNYRSVEGKAKPSARPVDEDLEFESDSAVADAEGLGEAQVRAENAVLAKKVKADPANVDAWLALVEYQAKAIFPSLDLDRLNHAQRRTLADVRLSILSQALKLAGKGNAQRDRLLLAEITEGSILWEASKLLQRWRDALIKAPNSRLLWERYHSYLHTSGGRFKYEACRDAYLESLRTLYDNHMRSPSSQQPVIAQIMIDVFLRFTGLLRDAGYDELALSIWQATLEIQLLSPELDDGPDLAAFRDFWDSDTPRIGESGSLGWRQSTEGGNKAGRTSLSSPAPELEPGRSFASFAYNESILSKGLHVPAAADEDLEMDDPFRFVMFSDIQPVLEHLPKNLPPPLLVDAFLCFMHLPPVQQDCELSAKWQLDPFLRLCTHFYTDEDEDGPGSGSAMRDTPFSLFHSAIRGFAAHHAVPRGREGTDKAVRFVDRTLERLVTTLPEYELLAEYWLAFQLELIPNEAPKTAKRLLKKRASNLRLYNAYALIQARTIGVAKANEVWNAALALSGVSEDDAILLWHSRLMTLIHHGDEDAALSCLLAIPNGSGSAILPEANDIGISTGRRLRASRHLEEQIDRLYLKGNMQLASLYIECLIWLQYLSNDFEPGTALQIFEKFSPRIAQAGSTFSLELLHQSKAALLSHYIDRKRPFQPSKFRGELEKSRKLFPENSVILEQHYRISALTRVDDRLRTAIRADDSTSSRGLISWSFAIREEIRRCDIDGALATRDSVRYLFRLALLGPDSMVGHSSDLWRMWLRFELPKHDDRGTILEHRWSKEAVVRAKQVFYDGLRYLPWCKSWVIEGMSLLHKCGALNEEELKRVYDVLGERELRVRVNMDDLV